MTAMLPELYRLIGSDRYLASEEVERAAGPHSATAAAWEVYTSVFHRFTGSCADQIQFVAVISGCGSGLSYVPMPSS